MLDTYVEVALFYCHLVGQVFVIMNKADELISSDASEPHAFWCIKAGWCARLTSFPGPPLAALAIEKLNTKFIFQLSTVLMKMN